MTRLLALSWRFLLLLGPERARRVSWAVARCPAVWAVDVRRGTREDTLDASHAAALAKQGRSGPALVARWQREETDSAHGVKCLTD
jgi:hypothetical protein